MDNPEVHGGWRVEADGTAAGGMKLRHPNTGAPKQNHVLTHPSHYFDITINDVEANVPYYLWVRGRADGNSTSNDSIYVQLTNTGIAPGTASALAVNLERCTGVGLSGWGWRDARWCEPGHVEPSAPIFSTSGPQTIRVQTREDGISIDQIVLSQTRDTSPGTSEDDTTILPR